VLHGNNCYHVKVASRIILGSLGSTEDVEIISIMRLKRFFVLLASSILVLISNT